VGEGGVLFSIGELQESSAHRYGRKCVLDLLQTGSEEEGIYLIFGSIFAIKISIHVCLQHVFGQKKHIEAAANAQDVLPDFPRVSFTK